MHSSHNYDFNIRLFVIDLILTFTSAQQYQSTLQETWRSLALLEQKPGVAHLTEKVKEILDKLSCEIKVATDIILFICSLLVYYEIKVTIALT